MAKEITELDQHCRAFLALCTFAVLSSATPDGEPEVTPRGGEPGFLRVVDPHTIMLPDRAGHLPLGRVTAKSSGLAMTWFDGPSSYTEPVSANRDDLHRLVDELPEDDVRAALFEVRTRRRRPAARGWPPAWFGAGAGHRTDTAARSEELLDEGFGDRA